MNVAMALAQGIRDLGTRRMFGLAGDANLFILEALVSDGAVEYIGAAHEAGAVAMAMGHAHATGELGVATVTHGPGLTNAITPLIEAVKSSVPLLLICGDTPRMAERHLQNVPQELLIASTGAAFQQVRAPETAVTDLAAAVRRARVESRPVVLNVPLDVQHAETGYVAPKVFAPLRPQTVDRGALDNAVGVIASARRPLILAGKGAVSARRALLDLSACLGAPVATTLLAKSLFEGEPSNAGIFGTFSSPASLDVINRADCVITFGASLSSHTTIDGSLLQGKAVVQCDVDSREIGRWYPVDAGVTGDAATTAETITDWLAGAEISPSSFADQAARLLEDNGTDEPRDRSTSSTIDMRTFVRHLDAMLPPERQVVFDAGRFMVEPARKLSVPHPSHFIFPLGFASVGLGVSIAAGAAFGRPEVMTVALVGDGGFMMGGIPDVHTSTKHGLGMVVIIFNDGSYGAEYVQLRQVDLATDVSMNHWPEFSPLARSLGATTLVVASTDDLDQLRRALDAKAPDETLVVDVRLDPAHVPDKHNPDDRDA